MDQLPNVLNDEDGRRDSKLRCSIRENNLKDGNEKVIKDFVAPITSTHPSSELQSVGKDLCLHTDRRIIEHELPELMVCYEDNTYHVIKDICIDEGIPSQDKFLFNTDFDEKTVCSLLCHGNNINDEMTTESHGIEMSSPDMVKCSAENENTGLHLPVAGVHTLSEEKGFTNQIFPEPEPENLKPSEGGTYDAMEKLTDAKLKEHFSLKDLVSTALFNEESTSESSNSSTVEIEELQSVQMARENVLMPPTSAHEFGSGREGMIQAPMISAAEDRGNSQEAFLTTPPFDKTTDRSITLDFGSSAPRLSSNNGYPQNVDSNHLEARNSSRLEHSNDKPLASQFQYDPGESSFSAAVPPSGLISYSGPIGAASNLSVRSDSSTTSTRSFAFPVLQSEWNSSPVRMAKGNRRQLQKHRRWRESILCCRF